MKAFFTLVLTLLGFSFAKAQEVPNLNPVEIMTTYFFIRHAEKDTSDPYNRDPHLSPEGLKRIQKWLEPFKETDLDLVYSTNFHRTRETATPIAATKGLEVKFYDPTEFYNEEFQQKTKGKTVLVVGHSNTNPFFVNAILKKNRYKDIDEAESGSLFIVSVDSSGETSCQVLYVN